MSVPGRRLSQYRASLGLQTASDELDDHCELECRACSKDGQNVNRAVGYCRTCRDYLCKSCFECHCVPMPTRNHVLVDEKNMPTVETSDNTCSDKCNEHRGEPIQYYCEQHTRLLCIACVKTEHTHCDDVKLIDSVAEGIEHMKEYTDLRKAFTEMGKRCYDNSKAAEKNIVEAASFYSQAIEDITNFRADLNEILDRIEDKLKSDARRLKDQADSLMNSIINLNQSTVKEIENMSSKMDAYLKSNKRSEVFIAMQNYKHQLKSFVKCAALLENENKIKRYRFEPENQLRNMKEFGKISPIRNINKYETKHSGDIKVKERIYSKDCWISGIVILADGQLALVDHRKQWVRLIDTHDNNIKDTLKLGSDPWDIVETTCGQLAVTMPVEGKIIFVSVSKAPRASLSKNRELKVEGSCHGIVYSQERLAITLKYPSKVQIIDMFGALLIDMPIDYINRQLFIEPEYLAINPDHKTLYVTDYNKDSVVSLSLDGKVKAVYKDKCISPTGVTVTKDGAVLVCATKSHEIYILSSDLTEQKVLLGQTGGLYFPESLAYSKETDSFYVGMKDGNKVKGFHLTYEQTEEDII